MDPKASAIEIVEKLQAHGHLAYFAGGWVRDYLLGHPSDDIDIATDASPQVILDLFPHTILVGLAFGVVIVVKNGHQFEVATFRRDIDYVGGRRPQQVELSTPEEDAKRRDFTINGMFYDPSNHEIFDYIGGVEDLKKGIIRSIGDPHERFVEDRLRMIRAIRFACHFGFLIDPLTREAIMENADTLFPAVAMERVWRELQRMAEGPRFDHALIELHSLGLLQQIFPRLAHVHLHDIKQRAAVLVHYPPGCPTILRLAALFPDASQEEKIDICRSMRVSNREVSLVQCSEAYKQMMQREKEVSPREWVYFYAQPASQIVIEADAAWFSPDQKLAVLKRHQLRRQSYERHIVRVIEKKPLVSSVMLKELGFNEGKCLGDMLKQAENLAISLDLNDPQEVLNRVLKKS